ncbi:L7Ae/L30e/S12e/Gadd45 family ribosomal protein [Spiroplasma turonicum]|uniref:Putative 50S ribosomal protein L7Ae n=1 Tax=Spiroplasma turonicum TaxID=216946 RepID=A0A0K1P5K0_9MOLU|nr:ribosomal L7Ae/L30e/S12e/Gadd45 family protein [Spiroplasma turonicum]AKU79568.1 putative 50S ribosomal protein L7Ae [Spiroplasma turonicum]ALX70591.1 putative 50S ribosomal protein L7Ae [Spiroplasma turonicum]
MNKDKLLNALGLVSAANKLIYGIKLFEKIKENKISLVIIASDIGISQHKKIKNKCNFYNVPYYDNLINGIELSKSIGKTNIKIIGIQDQNFIKLILKNI